MLTLYGTKGSGSAAVEAALEIAGLDYRKVDATSWQPSPGLDELRSVNPLAQIPTFVLDDGSVLTESAAILLLPGLSHPESGLIASDRRGARNGSAAWFMSPRIAMPASASSTIRSAGIPIRTTQ